MMQVKKQRQKNYPKEKLIFSAILIQKHWKGYITKKKYLKVLKRQKKKYFVVMQLLQSQRSYCDHIRLVIQDILKPSRDFITDQQVHAILFSNIEQIFNLHSHFLSNLEEIMKTYNHHNSMISKPLLNELFNKEQFKQAYTHYCFNYKKTDQLIKFLTDNNAAFTQYLKKIGINGSNMSLESYMIKPVQRLCKYGLMVDEYFRNMEMDHPDYGNIQKISVLIDKLVMETNQQVEQFLMRERYNELKWLYSSFFSKETNKKRQLYFESKSVRVYSVIKQQQTQYKSLLFFSDFIVLLPQVKDDSLCVVNYLFVRDLNNSKYVRHMIQIVDKMNYTYIQFENEKDKKQFYTIFEKRNNFIQGEEYKNYVKISILGTETRQSFFSSYTVYIVQINQKGVTTLIYPRFKDLLKVQDLMIGKGMKFDLPLLQKQSPYLTLKSKTIEKRKLTIQQFLQRILNCGNINHVNEVEQILGIGRALTKLNRNHSQEIEEISIFLPNMQKIKVSIPVKISKIKDLKAIISQQIGLQESNQFEIFQVRNKAYNNKKLIYNDESVLKLYEEQKQAQSSINPFRDKIQYIYTRHYYLSREQEDDIYKYDGARAELQLAVIHFQITNYRLEEQIMITFTCLFAIYINLRLEDSQKVSFFIKDLTKKNYKISQEEFRIYYQEVMRMVISQENLSSSIPVLTIKIISNCYLYQCQQFEVEVHHKCFSQIKKRVASNLQEKIILGLKPDVVYLLSPKDRNIIKRFQYSELTIIETHPNAVVYEILNIDPPFILKSLQVFEISKLFEIYKKRK